MTTFASSLTSAGVRINSFNPEKLKNNCAFVTIAYLLNTDSQSLCDFIGIRPSPSDAGVDLDTIIEALKRVGATYRWRNFMETKGAMPTEGSGWQGENRHRRYVGRGMPEGRLCGVGWPSQVGVAYRRADGTGHVVVLKLPGTPYRFYMDYQQCRRGRDVTREVKQGTAHLMFSISLEPPPSLEFHPGAHKQKWYIESSFDGGPQWTYRESRDGVKIEYMEEDRRSLPPDLDGEEVADNEEQCIEYMEQDRGSLSSPENEGVGDEYVTDDEGVGAEGVEDNDVDDNDYDDVDDERDEDIDDGGDENAPYTEANEEVLGNPYTENEIWSMSRDEVDEEDVDDGGDENVYYAEVNEQNWENSYTENENWSMSMDEGDEEDADDGGDENVHYAEVNEENGENPYTENEIWSMSRDEGDEEDADDGGGENVYYAEVNEEDWEDPYTENRIWSMSRIREALPY